MTKINLFINILFVIITIIFSAISQCSSALSDKRLCYDRECKVPVSLARTSLAYHAREPELLSFNVDVVATIYSKDAGNRTDIWGVEINGKRGYAPKAFLKEYKIYHKDLHHEVPTIKISANTNTPRTEEAKSENVDNKLDGSKKNTDSESNQVQGAVVTEKIKIQEPLINLNGAPPYEVIDGTTVYLEANEPSIQPTGVKETIQATALPDKQVTADKTSNADIKSKHVQSNSNSTDGKSSDKIVDSTKDKKDQDISVEKEIQNNLESSEEVSDIPEPIGITTNIPPIGINPVLVNNLHNKREVETDVKTEIPSDSEPVNIVDDKQPAEENKEPEEKDSVASDINQNSESSVDQSTDINDNNGINSDLVPNIEGIPPGKPEIQNATEKEALLIEPTVASAGVDTKVNASNTENKVESDKTEVKDNILELENQSPLSKDHAKKENVSTSELNSQTISAKSETETNPKEDIPSVPLELNVDSKEEILIDHSQVQEEETLGNNLINKTLENELLEKKELSEDSKPEVLVTNLETSTTEKPQLLDVVEENQLNSTPDTNQVSLPSSTDAVNITENLNEGVHTEIVEEHVENNVEKESEPEKQDSTATGIVVDANKTTIIDNVLENKTILDTPQDDDTNINIISSTDSQINDSTTAEVPIETTAPFEPNEEKSHLYSSGHALHSSQESLIAENAPNINEFRNRNLLNVEGNEQYETDKIVKGQPISADDKTLPEYGGDISNKVKVLDANSDNEDSVDIEKATTDIGSQDVQVAAPEVCSDNLDNINTDDFQNHGFSYKEEIPQNEVCAVMSSVKVEHNYWSALMYLTVTAVTTLMFTLGYYYIENMRRDGQLIAKINRLEKDLLVSTKECTMLTENLKTAKDKLTSIEDKSFGSNEMVVSLKAELEAAQIIRAELEDQVATLERDLESATEAGFELERMFREVVSSNNEVNPLAQSVEDLQARLEAQCAANESLTNALNLKAQENEALSADLTSLKKKYEELEVELTQVTENLRIEVDRKCSIERTFSEKVQQLEMQIIEISTEKAALQKELKAREVEMKDLTEVINQWNSNNLDLDKLYDVSRIKTEATTLLEERNELKIRLTEVEGAHNLLEEHMKVVKEEIASLTEQCKLAEKEKKDAETRLEVLTKFFNEKEAQRQKEEAIWMKKQGEVVSTVERIQTMQNEIQNYKQQLEMLKREILDQEREYKGQISALETKSHEQWVVARQVERRLEESKAEAAQLRNRLTLIEKNMNDADADTKLHRMDANGDTATSPPLFLGAESSSSPIMFTGSSGVPPPPPPSYMHCSLFPPYLPPPLPSGPGVPPYEVGQRPPPLGGRLSSPPPMPMHPPSSNRYDNTSSPPPPMSPHMLPPFNHRSPPPPFDGDHMYPPPPHIPGGMLPPPLGTTHSWGEESLPVIRNSGFHPHQREQRVRNHKGSLHSSGESLDKTHHSSKV